MHTQPTARDPRIVPFPTRVPGLRKALMTAARRAPRFSLVTAVYNVHRYLDAFIDSIEKQTHGLGDVEVIAVDDGSTDESLAMLTRWADRRPEVVRVLSQENAGQGAARNFGLQYATGEWVTFPDPDDVLEPDYLAQVVDFLDHNPDTAMVATARIFLNDSTGQIIDGHPLRQMFTEDRLLDLDKFSDFFHGSAPAAFLRREVIARTGLEFDVRIRPNFEDGHFCSKYLLAAGSVRVGFLGSARYLYRKRSDMSSTLDTGLLKPSRFTDVPRYGYLDLLESSAPTGGYAPEWVQNLVLYELSYYFSADAAMSGLTAAHGAVAVEFLDLLRQIVARIDPAVIDRFAVRPLESAWRDVMQHALSGGPWVAPYAVLDAADPDHDLVRLSYRFTGAAPSEIILCDGSPVAIEHGKIWTHAYFDHDLMHERIAWVPSTGSLQVQLDGRPTELRRGWPGPVPLPPRRAIRLATKAVRHLADAWPVRRLFRDAWVLMDRIHDADDNAERLFGYLRTERRDVNAWFVIERGTPDWDRLRREHGHRVVAHGGVVWRWLMLNCVHLASSHVDVPVHRPPEIVRMREPRWRFSFLQHGVIKDDLSRWLNPRRVDLFVTSTPGEQASVAGDYTHYAYTSKEARMTGLPRFDRLRELGSQVASAERDLVLVCPTWRLWLVPPSPPGSQRHGARDDFADTEFVQQWLAFLNDKRLAAAVAAAGLRLGFLPHPNLQPALPMLALPDHVQPLTFVGQDVQEMIARTAVLVTDYSSMAFNAAYLDRSVVYFQFDAAEMFGGSHMGEGGYFEYGRDGFGPVTRTAEQAVSEVVRIIGEPGQAPAPGYQTRIDATFPDRDGRCCERTTAAIEDMLPTPRGRRGRPGIRA